MFSFFHRQALRPVKDSTITWIFDAYHAIIAINTKFLRPSNTAMRSGRSVVSLGRLSSQRIASTWHHCMQAWPEKGWHASIGLVSAQFPCFLDLFSGGNLLASIGYHWSCAWCQACFLCAFVLLGEFFDSSQIVEHVTCMPMDLKSRCMHALGPWFGSLLRNCNELLATLKLNKALIFSAAMLVFLLLSAQFSAAAAVAMQRWVI